MSPSGQRTHLFAFCQMAGYLYKDKPFPGHCLSTSGYPGLPANQDLVMILAQQLQFALQLFCSALLISSLDVKE